MTRRRNRQTPTAPMRLRKEGKKKHCEDVAVLAPVDARTPALSVHWAGGLPFKWLPAMAVGAF